MTRIWAIAVNTFREAMRNKVLYTIVFFACLLILFAWVLGQLSLHEEMRVTRDLGLGGISLFGVVLAVFVGVNLVYKEIERKTVFALIPKPLGRSQFILGKFLGMVLTLGVQMGLMCGVLWLTLLAQGASGGGPPGGGGGGAGFDAVLLRAVLLLFMQVVVMTAIAVLFSSFSTPFLSGLFTAGLFAIGRSLPDLVTFVDTRIDSPVARRVVRVGLEILPDLHLFHVSGSLLDGKYVSVHTGGYVSWGYVAWASGYGLLYAACALVVAAVIFARRDFV